MSKVVVSVFIALSITACQGRGLWHRDVVGCVSSTKNLVEDVYRGIQFEIISYCGEKHGFFNLFCIPLKAQGCKATVTLCWDGEERQVLLPVMRGGQKLALSDTLTCELIGLLRSGKQIEVRVGRYQSSLLPDGFFKEG